MAEDREGLRQLLRHCQAGRVGTVVIPSLDRLSRDVRLAENLFYEFAKLAVEILITDMPNYNGKDRKDVLIRQIREAIAEENRKEIIERLWKGRQERIRRGLPPGGNVPYGYRRNGKRLVVNPGEAEIVRWSSSYVSEVRRTQGSPEPSTTRGSNGGTGGLGRSGR